MLGGVVFGHEQGNIAIDAIHELVRDAGKPEWDWQAPAKDEAFIAQGRRAGRGRRCARPTRSARKQARTQATREAYAGVDGRAAGRGRRLRQGQGRKPAVRHRSAASCAARSCPASRASTAATPAPCGRSRSATACCRAPTARRCSRAARRRRWSPPRSAPSATRRRIDALAGEYSEHFMLHYNMPPFATGETGRVGTPEAARDRPRPPRQARAGRGAAGPRRVPVLDARRLGDHRVERLVVDGLGVRRLPGADGRRRAAEGARRRHRDGPDQGRQPLRRADRHPRRRGSPRRHGLQGRRHDDRHHRAADGHQDPGHHQGDHAGRAGAGQGSAPAHPRQDAGGDGRRARPRCRSSRRACTR